MLTGTRETRLDKIARLIKGSKYSIHDISRVEITAASPLPRFNMAFECGLALGAMLFGSQRGGDFLLLTAVAHQDKITLSDLAGQDSKIHNNEPKAAIAAVRTFLDAKTEGPTRGSQAMWRRYERFTQALPKLARRFELELQEVLGFAFLRDYLRVAGDWIAEDAQRSATTG
jgi:hypothetical protein